MTKKENSFDLQTALTELQVADWIKEAFAKTVNVDKIKSKTELEKEFKKYMELK